MADNLPTEDEIKAEVARIVEAESELARIATDPAVQQFIQLQKKVENTGKVFWPLVEEQMIKAGIKSVKGPWGSVTVAEKTNFEVNMEELPKKFIIKAADKKAIGNYYKLTGSAPKGVTPSLTTYLTKRIKLPEEPVEDTNIIEGEAV